MAILTTHLPLITKAARRPARLRTAAKAAALAGTAWYALSLGLGDLPTTVTAIGSFFAAAGLP
ncbi:hypothetical protein [Phytohabitans rumicis]|uniref:Uncharacterized protein n=1 Tax=Phytohabitans rumicis TaxID=1076125 RepID=A0A6V8LJW9_9ACTN|nr:hypothetical protein [Phytohabitans rumicis]GFJ95241.1 hypothetical protein Prum_088830 [Phytohabitans rumicis]